jgi:hypothetical protein
MLKDVREALKKLVRRTSKMHLSKQEELSELERYK